MNKIELISKNILLIFPSALFLPMIFTNIITILMLVYLLIICFNKKERLKTVKESHVVCFFILLFLLCFNGLLHSIPFGDIWHDAEKKLSFLIIPAFIYSVKKEFLKVQILMRNLFLTGFLVMCFAFAKCLSNFYTSNDLNEFINHNLSQNIGFHATYISIILLFSLAYPVFFYHKIGKEINKRLIILISIAIIGFLVLLSVRIVWLSFIPLILILVFKNFKFLNSIRPIKITLVAITTALIIFLGFSIPPINERIKEAVNYNNDYTTNKVWGGRGMREIIWSNSISVILEKPLFGYGSTRTAQQALNDFYRKSSAGPLLYLMEKEDKKFNAHNQYLEEFLKYGIILGLVFPIGLLFFLLKAIKIRNFIAVFFLSVIILTSLTETILELNKGIVLITYLIPVAFRGFAN